MAGEGRREAIWVVVVSDRAEAAFRSRQVAERYAEDLMSRASSQRELVIVPKVTQLTLRDGYRPFPLEME